MEQVVHSYMAYGWPCGREAEIKELVEALGTCIDELMYTSTTGDLWMWARSNEPVPEKLLKIRELLQKQSTVKS